MLSYWWSEVLSDQPLLRVAVFEGASSPDGDVAFNVKQVDQQAKRASEEYKAQILVIPEVYISGYGLSPELTKNAAKYIVDEKVIDHFCSIARQYSLALLISYPELNEEKIYNSSTLINNEGKVLLTYRKTHLWAEKERELYTPGDELSPIAEICGVKVAVMICYDIEMVEVARSLALQGAQLILAPTALGVCPVNEKIVRNIVSARALENHVWIAYSNHPLPDFIGSSRIVGPDGEVIVSVTDDPLIVADLIPSQYTDSVRSVPYLADRRPSLFSAVCDPKYMRKLPESYRYTN